MSERATTPNSFRRAAGPWVAAALGLALVGLFALTWFDRWATVVPPIFGVRPEPRLHHFLYRNHPFDGTELGFFLSGRRPIFDLANLAIGAWGRSQHAILRMQAGLMVALALLAAGIGGARKGPFAAFLSGAFAFVMPVTLLMAGGADEFLYNVVCLFASALLLLTSNGLRRWPMALIAGYLAGHPIPQSLVFSTGLVNLAANASVAGACLLTALVTGGWRPSPRAQGWTMGLFQRRFLFNWIGFAAFVVGLVFGAQAWAYLIHVDWSYYAAETRPGRHTSESIPLLVNLIFYPLGILTHELGPYGTIALALGLFGLFRGRHPDRWIFATWFFTLLLALNWIPKKGFYYLYPCVAASIPIAGIGLACVPLRRWALVVAPALVMATGVWSFHEMFSPPNPLSPMLTRHEAVEPTSYDLALHGQGDPDSEHPVPGLDSIIRRRRPAGMTRELRLCGTGDFKPRLRYYLMAQDADLLIVPGFVPRAPDPGSPPLLIFFFASETRYPADGRDAVRLALAYEEKQAVSRKYESPFLQLLRKWDQQDPGLVKVYENPYARVFDVPLESLGKPTD